VPGDSGHGLVVKVPIPVCVKLTDPVGVVAVRPPPFTVSVTVAVQEVVPPVLTEDGEHETAVEVVSRVVTVTLTGPVRIVPDSPRTVTVVVVRVAVVLTVTVRVVGRMAPAASVRLVGRTLHVSPVGQAGATLKATVMEKLPRFATLTTSVPESVPERGRVMEILD
jgi:hypothetical protein